MKERLCSLVELAENNKDCVVLAVKDDVKPLDLIRLGGFSGDETMFRMSKDPSTIGVTVFNREGRSYTLNVGSSNTVVSGDLRQARDQIMQCVNLDFGIFTQGEWRNGHNFDQMVEMTLGPRDLDSPRRFELYRSGGSCSLYVNNMHIANIDYKNLDEWLAERNIRIEIQETKGFGADRTSVGTMVRASTPETLYQEPKEDIEPASPQAEQGDFSAMLDKCFDEFLKTDGWQRMDQPSVVCEFVMFAKKQVEPSLEDLKEKAREKTSERNAIRQPKTRRPDMER